VRARIVRSLMLTVIYSMTKKVKMTRTLTDFYDVHKTLMKLQVKNRQMGCFKVTVLLNHDM